jgi:hypothetical protein
MLNWIKNRNEKRELQIVLKWSERWQKENAKERQFASFKIWATARFINNKK